MRSTVETYPRKVFTILPWSRLFFDLNLFLHHYTGRGTAMRACLPRVVASPMAAFPLLPMMACWVFCHAHLLDSPSPAGHTCTPSLSTQTRAPCGKCHSKIESHELSTR